MNNNNNNSLQLSKLPPHSTEAERCVLGAILLENDSIIKTIGKIMPKDFYQTAHSEIFTVMLEMYNDNQTLDLVTLSEALLTAGKLETIGGTTYLMDLMEATPTATTITAWAKIVKTKSKLRRLILIANTINIHSYGETKTAAELTEFTINQVIELMDSNTSMRSLDDIVPEVLQHIEDITDSDSRVAGVPTGYTDIDEILGGLKKKDLVILAARPSLGKTSLGVNILVNIANSGIPGVFFSLETSSEQLGLRMLCADAKVDSRNFVRGNILERQWPRLVLSAGKLANLPIWIDDTPGISPMYVKAAVKKLLLKVPDLGFVGLDYLTLMQMGGRGFESRQQEVSKISQLLKNMAKEFNLPFFVLSQLSRACESRRPPRPILSDIRESGSIEQIADVVMFLYQPPQDTGGDEHTAIVELIVAKNRNGATGDIRMTFRKKFTSYENFSYENEDFQRTPF